jgi:hypothetical protein
MPQASRSPLRVTAALALALYAVVFTAGPAVFHDLLCAKDSAPHCAVCASVHVVASVVPPPPLLHRDATDAGATRANGQLSDSLVPASAASGRAPPMVG